MLRPFAALPSLALAVSPLDAQVGLASAARTLVLGANKHGSVGIALPGGGSATVSGGLGSGSNDFTPVAIETTWDLDPSRTSAVSLVAYFPAPAAALTGAGMVIPSSAIFARVPRSGSYEPFTGAPIRGGETTAGAAGGTVVVFSQPVTSGTAAGGRTDQLQVRIDLSGWPSLPAGQYQGTLNLLAITQ